MSKAVEKLNERLKRLIDDWLLKNVKNERKRSLSTFYSAIKEMAGSDAISRSNLHYAVNTEKKHHLSTLDQISKVLGVQISDLLIGTTAEPPKLGPASGYKELNEFSVLRNLWHGLPFKPQLLEIMKKGGETSHERISFLDNKKAYLFILILTGYVDLILEHPDKEEIIELKQKEVYCFDAGIYHRFRCKSKYAYIAKFTFKEGDPLE